MPETLCAPPPILLADDESYLRKQSGLLVTIAASSLPNYGCSF